jgi:cell division protein FtsQ
LLIQNGQSLTKSTKENLALKEMEAQVNAHPLIKNAEVYVKIDGSLGVQIEQRTPIARVNHNDSAPYYIGIEGEVMPLSSNFSARVPLVTGVSSKDIKEVHELITFIREDSFLEKHIIGIDKKTNGDFVLTPRTYSYKLVLGKVDKLALKFNNYKAFYKKAHNDKTVGDYNRITLKYDNQVVCTKKGD